MSADAWRFCPKCMKDNLDKNRKQREDLENSYGKVPIEEYERLKDKYNTKVEEYETLREDYEISTEVDGTFEVSYVCSCSVCGFSFQFNHKEKVV